MPKICKVWPNWRNFAKSGHAAGGQSHKCFKIVKYDEWKGFKQTDTIIRIGQVYTGT